MPDEHTFAILAADMRRASAEGQLGTVARRLNFYLPEFRSLLMRTARQLPETAPPAWKPALIELDPRWGTHDIWRILKRSAVSPTPDYLLGAVDATVTPDGSIASLPADSSVFVNAFARTVWISASVTLLCLVLGYPVAYLLATLPRSQEQPPDAAGDRAVLDLAARAHDRVVRAACNRAASSTACSWGWVSSAIPCRCCSIEPAC